MKLNIGSGGKKLPGWVNVDFEPMEEPDVVLDLNDPWPWPDSSVDEIFASHILEHVAPGKPFMHVMAEMWRVCKPGAEVNIILPHPRHEIFLNDPTHLHAIMPGTLVMFSKTYSDALALRGQRLTPFWKYLGIDFTMGKVRYWFDPDVDGDDPELEWKAKHLSNIIKEWGTTLTVVKP